MTNMFNGSAQIDMVRARIKPVCPVSLVAPELWNNLPNKESGFCMSPEEVTLTRKYGVHPEGQTVSRFRGERRGILHPAVTAKSR